MKRIHIHVGVENLDKNIKFYTALFGAKPVKIKSDYAKWMIDDPRINFAISTRTDKKGIDHLGIQVEENSELEELRERFKSANMAVFDEGETVCCYSRSEKSWVKDPTGIAWETYKAMEDAQIYSNTKATASKICCSPETMRQPEHYVPSKKTLADKVNACC